MTVPISAIICTHNRDQYLGKAIDSLLAQEGVEYEIIIIDNASSDRTREVVEARMPHARLSYHYEATLGLSVARNRGFKESQGEILAYLDDDAIASPHWLATLSQAYQNNAKLAIAGGKVTLLWPENTEPPTWLSDSLAGNLGLYDLGNQLKLIKKPGLTPRGLNYSIRRSFLAKIGGFDVNLGRVGTSLLSNEELQMTELALNQGWQVAYLPAALVAHHVAPERLNRSWFLRRGWWQGVSECYRDRLAGRTHVKYLPVVGERLIRGSYKWLKYIQDPAQRFDNLVYIYSQIGYLKTWLADRITETPI
ncbi:MAG: glycosyltransferase [Jaaginema sp. PMC 1079.18]|nr:glycosyltransferase [Jaaginema sp. PMC 1080.18]MEC4853811.1 glycosyltransferase [Jaaginema sp. PMC 1079.18]MEC4869101.1 glycosyltransferase [Jaaginema sp. PMC 1078.18]